MPVWGHISDGNIHPNVLAESARQMEEAREALIDIGRWTVSQGGAPVCEHGVGKNPDRQKLLEFLYGAEGIRQMKAIKNAFDPAGILSPGVLFENRTQDPQ